MSLDHVELSTDDARQGETGHHVRYILGWGTLLVVLAFGVLAAVTL
jgi:hypothetical protein